jgi:hypothetical protein
VHSSNKRQVTYLLSLLLSQIFRKSPNSRPDQSCVICDGQSGNATGFLRVSPFNTIPPGYTVWCPVWKAENAAVGFDVLTTYQPNTVWCSRERLPAAAAQPATDYFILSGGHSSETSFHSISMKNKKSNCNIN